MVWLHTVLQTRFAMMSDDGNGLNMPEAARYSLDPCIHFITHLPLSSEICPFFFKYSILLPFFPSSSSLHVSSLALKTFYRNSLNISPLPSPISHLPSPSNLPFYIYIYFKPRIPTHSLPPLPIPPQKRDFFPPYPHPILPSSACSLPRSPRSIEWYCVFYVWLLG